MEIVFTEIAINLLLENIEIYQYIPIIGTTFCIGKSRLCTLGLLPVLHGFSMAIKISA